MVRLMGYGSPPWARRRSRHRIDEPTSRAWNSQLDRIGRVQCDHAADAEPGPAMVVPRMEGSSASVSARSKFLERFLQRGEPR